MSKKRITSINTKRIAELREKHNLTQKEFSESLNNVSTDMISKIEQQKKPLTLDMALKICERYPDASLDWLFELKDEFKDTSNKADNILSNLEDFFYFEYTSDKNKQSESPKLRIKEDLNNLLYSLEEAKKFKEQKGLPNEAYEAWVDKIKQEYNKKNRIRNG